MRPGVVADHVAVGEHLALDRPGRIELADLVANLEECRRDVQAGEQVDEVDRRRLIPRSVVERQRDLVDVRRAAEDQRRPRRDAPDHLRDVDLEQRRSRREQVEAARLGLRQAAARGAAKRADHLPADRHVAVPMSPGRNVAVRVRAFERPIVAVIRWPGPRPLAAIRE